MNLRSWMTLPSLPLLTKDLIEMAARKRTYLLRVVAAVLMYLVALSVLGDQLRYNNSGYALLGAGEGVMYTVVWSLLAGIYLFLPAVMCPAIASERESGTLTLIMLTTMRPWQIVLQKLGSRLVPVLSLLCIALPLLGVAYTLGGINEYIIWDSAYVLVVAMFQVGCITLMWSAFCRTPAGAFFLTYLTLAAMYIGWPILILFASEGDAATAAFVFHPPALLFVTVVPVGGLPISLYAISVGCWVTTAIALVLARVFLVSRQHIQKRNRVRQIVHAVDATLAGANVTTATSSRSLPADKAIAWSELHRSALGRIRYLVIILVAVQIPVIGIAMLIYADYAFSGYHYGQMEGMSAFVLFLWPLCAIGLTMIAAGLIPNERNRQTLDVLLTTPIDTRRIVAEKLAGVSRLRIVLAAPLLTVALLEASYEWGHVNDPRAGVYLLLSVFTVAIYFWTLTWLAMWIGMRTRSARRAVMTAVGVVFGLCIGPLILAGLSFGLFNADEFGELLLGTSPIVFVSLLEFNDLDELGDPALTAILHLGLWLGMGLIARLMVVVGADRMLGRVAASRPPV